MKRSRAGTRAEHDEAEDLVAKVEELLGERRAPEHIPDMSVPPSPDWEDGFASSSERAPSAFIPSQGAQTGRGNRSMRRPILAIIFFNIYAVCLLGAFQVNTAYLFETDLIEQLRGSDLDVRPPANGGGETTTSGDCFPV